MSDVRLEVRGVTKSFGASVVLKQVSLSVRDREIVALLGPSGCGKTTLLRVIAGLEQPDEGVVMFDGRDVTAVPASQRGFGLMFQDYALFPHMDVAGNVAFGLEMRGWDRPRIEARVAEILGLVGLQGYGRRRVFELSGGEQQRVALARSLAPEPQVLMLDEPLGSLDRALREQLLDELRRILRRVGVMAIYVTHDQQEAFALADRVVLMREGRIVQEGAPEEVYRHPADAFVARFLGLPNLIPAQIVGPHQVRTPLGVMAVADPLEPSSDGRGLLVVRPESARLTHGDDEGDNVIEGEVVDCSFRGSLYRVRVRHASGVELELDVDPVDDGSPRVGEILRLRLRREKLTLLLGGVD